MPESTKNINELVARLSDQIDAIDRKVSEKESRGNTVQMDAYSVVRLTERIQFIEEKIKDVRENIEKLITALDKYEEKVDTTFVTKNDYEPIKKLVYGAVAFILISVLSAFMLLVVKSNSDIKPALEKSTPTISSTK